MLWETPLNGKSHRAGAEARAGLSIPGAGWSSSCEPPYWPWSTHHSHPHFSGWETEVLPQSRAWGPWLEVCQSHPPLEPEVTASNPMASCGY